MLRKKKEAQQITPEAIAAELEKVNLDASTPEEENNFWEKYEEQQEKIEKQHRGARSCLSRGYKKRRLA